MEKNSRVRLVKVLVVLSLFAVLTTGCFQPATDPGQSTGGNAGEGETGGMDEPAATATATATPSSGEPPTLAPGQPTIPPIAQTTTALAATMAATGVSVPAQPAGQTTPSEGEAGETAIPPTVDPNAPTPDPSVATLAPTPTNPIQLAKTPTSIPEAEPDSCTHVLQQGENLFRLSLAWDTTVEAITSLNGIVNANDVKAGMVLRIPNCTPGQGTDSAVAPADEGEAPSGGGQTYVVQNGDTLFAISQRFGVSVADIIAINPALQANPDQLSVGQEIVIP